MDINDIYGIIDKFDASGCSELNLEMNGVCLGLKKTMHEAICDVPVKKDIVRINTEQEQTVTTIPDELIVSIIISFTFSNVIVLFSLNNFI